MNDLTELNAALALLRAAYPGRFPDESVRVYTRLLSDVPGEQLVLAVEQELRGGDRDFIPPISALRRRVAENTLQLPSEAEAWDMAGLMAREGPGAVTLPAPVEAAYRSAGGRWTFRTSENQGVLRSQFQRDYGQRREEAISEAAMGDLSGRPALVSSTLATLPASDQLALRSFMTWDGVTPITDRMKHDAIMALRDLPPEHVGALAAFHLFDMCSE